MSEKVITLSKLSRFKSNYDTYVAGLIASAIAGVYKPKGTKTVAQLNALTGQHEGDVYNVSDSGTLTAGNVTVVAGDNVVWTSGNEWDKLAGTVDLSGYLPLTAGTNKKLTGDLYVKKISSFGDSNLVLHSDDDGVVIDYGGWLIFSDATYGKTVALSIDDVPNSSNLTIKLPNASGTLALLSDISSTNIIAALGYTPYSSSNPSGYITGITSTMVVNALGYTPLGPSDYATDSDIDALFA